ncbi:MAG TPA: flagellar export protein FliJ [Bacteroidetes bacterium]|nr:flagellar export protein FliJ [Bacteroidota bacterium]
MKRFKFSLEQVLNLKTNMKRQVQQELAGLEAQRVRIEEKIEHIGEQWQRENEALQNANESLQAAEYQLRLSYLDFLDKKINSEKEQLFRVMDQLAEKRNKLLTITREEQMLEKLRERKAEQHRKEVVRAEQSFNDEIAARSTGWKVVSAVDSKRHVL